MKVLVCGGRDFGLGWQEYNFIFSTLNELDPAPTEIITGNAKGTDTAALLWADLKGIATKAFGANWERDGKAAGPIRNQRMLDEGQPDLVIAFPGGKGTADMVLRAKITGIPVREILVDDQGR